MLICSSCGAENPEGFRFCGSCAAPLTVIEPAAREMRKTVTVVFCDVTGSTSLGERLDPESLRRVMLRYFESMKQVIERHGGRVEKFIGDALMAVFGVPLLHEDDALRAVRAAAEMREGLVKLNAELGISFGTTLEARIGVNTGEVVTGTEERLATGDAVNVAARLEQAAAAGEILIGAETLGLVRASVKVEPVEPLSLKGKSEPVAAFRLVSVHSLARADEARPDVPMVGRARELRRLQDAYAQAAADASCQLFTILGAAGVGKSRLVHEFLSKLAGTSVVQGRCLSYGEGISYWPVVEVVKQILSDNQAASVAELAIGELASDAIAGLLGEQASPSSSEEIAWAARRLFETVATERPLVVVFDDIHWGEPTFLDLVEHVADLSRDAPILLVCMARPELLDGRPGWGGGKLNATTVLLEPLAAAETETLIGQLLGDGGPGAALRARIGEAAEGNPLFVEEMVALLRDAPGGEVTVPATVQALLAARLDQLEPSERSVLERGSVEGRVFHRGAVQALAAEPGRVPAHLVTLVRKELLRPNRPQLDGEDAFRFRHQLIRDAAYEALPKAVRADLHERLAGWLEEHGQDLVELDELLGYHLEQTFRYRSELGPLDEPTIAVGVRAGQRLASAGQRAAARRDVRAAINLLGRALAVHEPEKGGVSLRLDLADAMAVSGQGAAAVATAKDAAARATADGDQLGALRASLHAEEINALLDPEGADERILALAEEARPRFEQAGDDLGMSEVWLIIGAVEGGRGHAGAAVAAYGQAEAHAHNAGDPREQQQAQVAGAGSRVLGPTPVEQVLSWLDAQGAAVALRRPHLTGVRAVLVAMQGRFDDARALVAACFERAADLGIDAGGYTGYSWRVETLAGDHLAAERAARHGYELLEQSGSIGVSSTHACLLALSLFELGRYAEAEAALALAEERSASDDIANRILVPQVRAKLLAQRGDHDTAERLARQAVATAEQTDWLDIHGDALTDLAQVLSLANQHLEAATMLERARELYEQKGNVVSVAKTRALIAELQTPAAPRSRR